jgi:TP901 family phage tail tape measure protein
MADKVLDRIKVILSGDTIALTKALQGAEAAMKQSGRRMQAIGKTMSMRITLPMLALGAASVKAFADFDSAMTQSLAIMGKEAQGFRGEMEEAAKEVARTTTLSATKAAESYFFLASAGLDAEQSIAALPQVARFAQAGMFDMATATDLATDAQSALGLTVDDAQQNLRNLTKVTDILVTANTLANASVLQFSEALTREAGAAIKAYNMELEEGVAVLAAFADQGIKGQVAGSGFARIMRLMQQAATNNKDELEALGLAIFDDNEQLRDFADIVEDMENVFGALTPEMRTAKLEAIGFTARVQGILLPLLGTSKAIRQYREDLRDAAGMTEKVASEQLKSFSAQLKITWNNVVLAAMAIGEVMAPAVTKLSEAIRVAAQWFDGLSVEGKTTIVVFGGLAAALGPVVFGLGTLLRIMPFALSGFKLMIPAVVGLKGALAALGIGLGPAGLVIAGLGWLAVMFLRAKSAANEARIATMRATEEFNAAFAVMTPKQAQRRVEQFTASIAKLKEEQAELRAEAARAAVAEGTLSDVTTTRTEQMESSAEATGRVMGVLGAEVADSAAAAEAALNQVGAASGRSAADLNASADSLDVLIESQEGLLLVAQATAAALDDIEPPPTDGTKLTPLQQAIQDLQKALAQAAAFNELLGDSFDYTAAEAEAYKTAIQSLVEAGVDLDKQVGPQGETLRELAEKYKDLVFQIEGTEISQTELASRLSEGAALTQDLLTPTEAYEQSMTRLKQLLAVNAINQETYNRAVKRTKAALERAKETGESWGEAMQQVSANAFESFSQFATDSKMTFRDFVNDVIRQLQRLATQMALTELFKLVGFTSAAAGGGVAMPFQRGGFLPPGELGLVGEAGPELIQPGHTGSRIRIPLQEEAPVVRRIGWIGPQRLPDLAAPPAIPAATAPVPPMPAAAAAPRPPAVAAPTPTAPPPATRRPGWVGPQRVVVEPPPEPGAVTTTVPTPAIEPRPIYTGGQVRLGVGIDLPPGTPPEVLREAAPTLSAARVGVRMEGVVLPQPEVDVEQPAIPAGEGSTSIPAGEVRLTPYERAEAAELAALPPLPPPPEMPAIPAGESPTPIAAGEARRPPTVVPPLLEEAGVDASVLTTPAQPGTPGVPPTAAPFTVPPITTPAQPGMPGVPPTAAPFTVPPIGTPAQPELERFLTGEIGVVEQSGQVEVPDLPRVGRKRLGVVGMGGPQLIRAPRTGLTIQPMRHIDFFAQGGFLPAGGIGVVGEEGPELVQAGRGGLTAAPAERADGAAAPGGESGGANVNVNIYANDAKSFADMVEANPGAVTGPVVRAIARSETLKKALSR